MIQILPILPGRAMMKMLGYLWPINFLPTGLFSRQR